MTMGSGRVVLLLVFSLLVLFSSSVLGSQFCTKDAGFQHVSPILCPVAKIRMCWNVTDLPGLGPPEKLLVLRVEAKVTGYMSVGFMDKSLIGKADVITFYVDEDGDGQAIDGTMSTYTVGSGTHGELLRDSRDNDVMVIGGEERFFNGGSSDGHVDGKYSAVTIRRKFRTDDAEDYEILPGTETGIIWFTSKTAKPTVDGTTGAVTVPTYGYKYPNGNKGTWKVTFEESQSVLSCEYYCSLQQNVCGDSQEKESQYSSESECLARCSTYIAGGAWTLGDIQQDHATQSLACRINAAHQAENAPAEDDALRQQLCDSSGVSGGGSCGTYCENYCSHLGTIEVSEKCGYNMGMPRLMQSYSICLGECAGSVFTDYGPSQQYIVSDARYNSANFPFYNTAACRTLHASLVYDFSSPSKGALPSWLAYGPGNRCSDASPASQSCTNTSVPTCGHYCESVMDTCTGPRKQFDSLDKCMSWCGTALSEGGGLAAGKHTDVSGEYTLGCLTYIAEHATSDDLCNASKDGGSLCPPSTNAQTPAQTTAPVPNSSPAPAPAPTPSSSPTPSSAQGPSSNAQDDNSKVAIGANENSAADAALKKDDSKNKTDDNLGKIIGIASGVGVFLAVSAVFGNYYYRKKRKEASIKPQKFIDLQPPNI